jgi:hypothetical protein
MDVAFLERGACMQTRDFGPATAFEDQWEYLCALPCVL